jgi:hypothetical protein
VPHICNHCLESSCCARADLTDDDLVSALAQLCDVRLTTLDLRGNAISDAGAFELAARLAEEACSVSTLLLWGNRIGVNGLAALTAALEDNESLATFDLGKQQVRWRTTWTPVLHPPHAQSRCAVERTDVWVVCGHVQQTIIKCDTTVLACDNAVGDGIASRLAAALKRNGTLTAADLRYSGMTDAGALALAEALPTMKAVGKRGSDPTQKAPARTSRNARSAARLGRQCRSSPSQDMIVLTPSRGSPVCAAAVAATVSPRSALQRHRRSRNSSARCWHGRRRQPARAPRACAVQQVLRPGRRHPCGRDGRRLEIRAAGTWA